MDGTVWTSGCTSWYLGDGEVPVVWPYDRRRWREILREPVLDDYEIRTAADVRERPAPASAMWASFATADTASSIRRHAPLRGNSVR
jgi:hypothetical protein